MRLKSDALHRFTLVTISDMNLKLSPLQFLQQQIPLLGGGSGTLSELFSLFRVYFSGVTLRSVRWEFVK